MKCPVCQAKLLPVDGEMFCLQCGNVAPVVAGEDNSGPNIDETTDPLLQKAIVDAVQHEVHFRLPVSGVVPSFKTTAFSSVRQIIASPPLVVASTGAATTMPVPAVSVVTKAVIPPVVEAKLELPPSAVEVKTKVDSLNLFSSKEKPSRPLFRVRRWQGLPLAWAVGLGVFGLFLAVNAGLYGYYNDRVYPGVRVGQTALGGTHLSGLREKLSAASVMAPGLTVDVNGLKYQLDANVVGGPDLDRLEREVRDVGRTTPLPLAGVVRALVSQPVASSYVVYDEALRKTAVQLAQVASHRSHDAVPIIVDGKAFVIAQKAGSRLETRKVEADLRAAYGVKTSLVLRPDKVEPVVLASAYKTDVELAQAKLALSLRVKVKTVTYAPTSAQVGEWLTFKGPGKGIGVDGAKVSAYVAALPGNFDRLGATNALIAAIEAGQGVNYTASTSVQKVSAAPQLASTSPALPLVTFQYCVEPAESSNGLSGAAETLSNSGWSLAGRIRFEKVASDCNFSLLAAKPADIAKASAPCAGYATCLVGNVLAIDEEKWQAAPKTWQSSLEVYQGELIVQVVGHWLGFDRSGCITPAAKPNLEAPTLVLNGCSPYWYLVPVEDQSTKVFADF